MAKGSKKQQQPVSARFLNDFMEFTAGDIQKTRKLEKGHVVYPSGKPMILHLLRSQGFGVAYYSLTLGRLVSTAPSAFATLGFV